MPTARLLSRPAPAREQQRHEFAGHIATLDPVPHGTASAGHSGHTGSRFFPLFAPRRQGHRLTIEHHAARTLGYRGHSIRRDVCPPLPPVSPLCFLPAQTQLRLGRSASNGTALLRGSCALIWQRLRAVRSRRCAGRAARCRSLLERGRHDLVRLVRVRHSSRCQEHTRSSAAGALSALRDPLSWIDRR